MLVVNDMEKFCHQLLQQQQQQLLLLLLLLV
jgi:hypothetical protein